MTSIDKAAIVFSIAIVAAGVGFAMYGGNIQDNAPTSPATIIKQPTPIKETPPVPIKETPPVPIKETPPVPIKETPPVPAGPLTVSVTIPTATSSPGCEVTNECYLPPTSTIKVGDTVEWNNVDTAAHTVTSGSPADGPSGAFDSSLMMAGANYSHTFDKAGNYKYFCMVHPWMVGNVQVN